MELSKEQKKILDALVDKYEKSATFLGKNKVKQRFQIRPEVLFPRYMDDAEYDYFVYLNEILARLEQLGFVVCKTERSCVQKVLLRPEKLNEIYQTLGRTSKSELMRELNEFLRGKHTEIEKKDEAEAADNEVAEALDKYIENQYKRIEKGKLPEFFDSSMKDYGDLWKCLMYLVRSEEEIYVRDLSVLLYQDSKRLEAIRNRIETLLFKYGDFSEKENVLMECGVIQNPTYIQLKGQVKIEMESQQLDIGLLSGDIGFSAKTLADISAIHIYGDRLITVENLTSFHRLNPQKKAAVLYLGGYHNRARRELLKKIREQNTGIAYYHFGDIDAGGFYIYEHLRKQTGIPFQTWKMDRKTLEQNRSRAQHLSENDRLRLEKLKQQYQEREDKDFQDIKNIDTISMMLKEDLKLEQEAIWELSL